ncbi:MAG: hypothetical protein WCT50_03790 [Patescibacteria group bacterium]
MKNLKIPEINNENFLSEMIGKKREPQRAILSGVFDKVKSRYNDYELKKKELELLPIESWEQWQGSALRSCYVTKTKILHQLDKIKAKIIELNNSNVCQYCGISPVKPFDHYLPKSIFPEFSIFSLNLVPCCSDCNNKKLEKWLNEDGIREFLNFYFDPIDAAEIFLYCNIESANDKFVPIFSLNFSEEFDINFSTLIKNHFINLNLLEKYSQNSSEEISSIMDIIINTYKREESLPAKNILYSKIKTWIEDDADSKRLLKGGNNWKAALRDGLASSEGFINYCIEGIINYQAFNDI